jgi:putative SOS response-associated peptidase YedK
MKEIHDRQLVILYPKDFEEWLTPSERLPIHLLRILPDDAMQTILLEGPIVKPEEPPMKEGFD